MTKFHVAALVSGFQVLRVCWLTVALGNLNNRAIVNVISNICAHPTMTSQMTAVKRADCTIKLLYTTSKQKETH